MERRIKDYEGVIDPKQGVTDPFGAEARKFQEMLESEEFKKEQEFARKAIGPLKERRDFLVQRLEEELAKRKAAGLD